MTPLYAGMLFSSNVTQLPIVWRANGIWVLRPDSSHEARARAVNWSNAPVALHYPFQLSDVALAVDADGREILRAGNEKIELWRDGRRAATVAEPQKHNSNGEMNPSPPTLLAIAPDGTRWASVSQLNGLFSSDEPQALSSDGITLWDADARRDIARLNAQLGSITALAFSPDSQQLAAVAADGYAFIWKASDGKLVRKWRAHPWVAATVTWSPDSQTLATGGNPRLGQAGGWTLSLTNGLSIGGGGSFASGGGTLSYKKAELKIKTDAQNNLTINSQTDRSLRLWNAKSGVMLRKWESQTGICSAQFSPDGRELAIGTHGQALIMEAATLKIKRRLPMKDYPQWPASVAWAPDGNTLAVACAPQLTLWRAR